MARKPQKICSQAKTPDRQQPLAVKPVIIHLCALAVILFCGLFCYANTFSVPFVLDDVTSILTNPLVKNFDFRLKTRIIGDLSFALNYRLGGFEVASYHLVNLLLHLLNAVLVYLLVQLIFRTPLLSGLNGDKQAPMPPPLVIGFVAALVFVAHPLQTQAVTYIAQRVTALAACFYLGAIICYAGSRLSAKRPAAAALLALSLLLAIAGVLAKENAVTIPLAILLFEVTFFQGDLRKRLLPLAWYLLPLLAAPLMLLGRIGFSADMLGEVSRLTAESGAPSRTTYLFTQFPVIVSYLRLFFFPSGQNLDHDVPLRTTLLDPAVIMSIILLTAIAAGGCRLWLRGRRATGTADAVLALPAFGIGWFFITLLVESSVIPIRDVMFEHRLYLPSVGLVTGLAAAAWLVAWRWTGSDAKKSAQVVLAVGCMMALLLAGATVIRNRVWQDEITLWKDVVAKSPGKARAHGSLGHALQRAGRQQEALGSYQEAVKLAPGDHIARNNLGTVYLAMNQPAAAITQFQEGIRSAPANVQLRYNLGLANARLERFSEAEAAYREALRLDSRNDMAWNNLGIVLYRQGRVREAMAAFRESLGINPGNEGAAKNLQALGNPTNSKPQVVQK